MRGAGDTVTGPAATEEGPPGPAPAGTVSDREAALEAEVAHLRAEVERLRAELRLVQRDRHERPPHWG